MSTLNNKQIAFLDEYFMNGFHASAAYLTVYKPKDIRVAEAAASRLLSNVNIASEVQKRKKILSDKYNITMEKLIDMTAEVIESCKKEGLDGTGILKDRTNWIKSIEFLAKISGLNVQKVEVNNVNPPFIININELTKEEDESSPEAE